MKKILNVLIFVFITFQSFAQLAEGAFAPDFTLTDINGVTHKLYNYLDSGYTVIIDVSATWCGPCWGYHNAHHLKELYNQHGPGTTDNKVRVLFIEGDVSTNSADLNGTGSNTWGNWVEGTPYPIIDLNSSNSSFSSNYKIKYFPTIYAICPNRQVTEIGQQTAENLWTNSNTYCGDKIATVNNDAALISYLGNSNDCKTPTVKVKMQNMGKNPLTSATITAEPEGLAPIVYNWTGNLASYNFVDVTVGTLPISTNTKLKVKVTSTDDNPANNELNTNLLFPKLSKSTSAVIKVATDKFGAQMTWKVVANSITLKSGGPYTNQPNVGTFPQEDVTMALPFNSCYRVEVTDSGNNGISGAYGDGYVKVFDLAGNEMVSIAEFEGSALGVFKKDATSANEELDPAVATIYPNPSSDAFIISSTQHDLQLYVENVMGQRVNAKLTSADGVYTVDMSSFPSGTYFLRVKNGEQLESHKLMLVK